MRADVGEYITEAGIGLRFKADWKIWSNPLPRELLQASEADIQEVVFFNPDHFTACYPQSLVRVHAECCSKAPLR